MANDISTTRWQIDTLPFKYPYRVFILSAEWSGETALGDTLLFTDNNDKPLFTSKASAADFMQNWPKQGWVNGVKGVTLTSGVLTINVGGAK